MAQRIFDLINQIKEVAEQFPVTLGFLEEDLFKLELTALRLSGVAGQGRLPAGLQPQFFTQGSELLPILSFRKSNDVERPDLLIRLAKAIESEVVVRYSNLSALALAIRTMEDESS